MNTKRKGNINEYKVISLFENNGIKCTRSAASLGEWDIIGLDKNNIYLVQVKSNRPPQKKEMETLKAFSNIRCSHCGNKISKKLLYIWRDYSRVPDIIEIGEKNMENFRIVDYWMNVHSGMACFKVVKHSQVYMLEKECKNFNLGNLIKELDELENITIDSFIEKYNSYKLYRM